MHESKHWRLVCYDIRDPKRYRQAHKLIKGYGEPVQFSIFRCRMDDRQTAQLRWELSQILDAVDSLLIVDICLRCAKQVVSQNQKAGWDEAPPTFAIAGAPPARPREPATDQAPACAAEKMDDSEAKL